MIKDNNNNKEQLLNEISELSRRIVELEKSEIKNNPAEKVLQESETRFRELFDAVTSGVAIYEVRNDGLLGKDYIIKDFNRMGQQMEGCRKEDVIGKTLFDLRPAIDEYGIIPVFRNVWKTGVPEYYPQKIYIDEKFANYYEHRVFRLSGGDIVAICNDTTELKRVEQALLESEERYRIAIEHSNDGIAIVCGNNYVFVNKRFLEIFGYDRLEEVVGEPISLTVHPDDRERVMGFSRGRQKSEPVPSVYEMKGVKKDGEMVNIEVSATNIAFHGEPASLAYLRDITDRKQREKELAENVEQITQAKQEWESLVDSLSELVLLLDEKGRIIRSNRTVERWELGQTDNVRGRTPHDILHPDCTKFDCYLRNFISNGLRNSAVGRPAELEVKDKVLKWYLDIRMRPIHTQQDKTGLPNGSFAVLVIHDITERRQARESLTEAYEELKETQQELIRIEKLALLGKFSSGVAHEIRNPLANIRASAQFCLAKYELDEEIKKHLRIMMKNSDHANNIIKDLIDLAKPSEVSLESGNINDVINSVCDLVKTRCEKQHILLHKKISRRLPPILMDRERIGKALLNFVVNAIDAMPGGGKLAISAYPHFDKSEIIINILDTGHGIPREDLENIFHPFFTTKRTGIGLGLCLADQVINSHKGRLSIDSKVGEGTAITLKLPISREAKATQRGEEEWKKY
jgi:PAS domain S-box-containing protein